MTPHFSEGEWIEIVAQWKSSNLTKKAFCDQKGLGLTQFEYWKRKIARRQKETTSFIRISPRTHTNSPMVLSIGTLFRLEIGETCSAHQVKEIIHMLKECL